MKRKVLFRYDRRLNTNEEVIKVVLESWASLDRPKVSERLAATRRALSEWNKLEQQNSKVLIKQRKQELEAALTSPLNDTALIKEIGDKLNDAYLAEEAFWKQRSRLLWLS